MSAPLTDSGQGMAPGRGWLRLPTQLRIAGQEVPLPPLSSLAVPMLAVVVLAMMLLPLPAPVLDFLFTFNIASSLLVLLVAVYTVKALDFAVFPTVLLVTTLMRLSLSVASTRAVLLHGHTGTDAAGKVIEAFANFLIGGNYAVGIIVFAILTVINFMVVTKGAGRIAEVSARFALDAMPGKQMAIDADLNAGQIDQAEARRRRQEVSREADFYGSMDGASKFVRGDAIASILILVINLVGGLIIGVVQHSLPLATAANNYVLLAIGDALVAQVPSLVISVAAGLLVSRVGDGNDDIGKQIASQLFSLPRALGLVALIVGVLGVIPGMPHIAFLSLAAMLGYVSFKLSVVAKEAPASAEEVVPAAAGDGDATWEDVQPVDILSLEVGYKLIQLVDKSNGGDLLMRIKGVRRKFAQEIGFLPPPVHVRDQLDLRPNNYRIGLKGVTVGTGEAYPGMWLAIDPGHADVRLNGMQTRDPAFGLNAYWIQSSEKDMAQAAGYTVVDASTVVATHLHHLMQLYAWRLLGRGEVQQLLDHLAQYSPKLVEEVVPKLVPVPMFQKVLQNLLEESVHIRDLKTIVESLAEHGAKIQDPGELTREVRVALAPAIVQGIFGPSADLSVAALDPALESLLMQSFGPGSNGALDPSVADFLATEAARICQQQEALGLPACLLVPDRIRPQVAAMVRKAAPRLRVLAHAEIPDTHTIRIGQLIGSNR
ncbi:flagellar biosynthesis protein FlhA [Lautropia mirabilis ATCC 51599]|uniref:Flagellar biosynthesis protein FlhA n=1 Tax=Lautropia mirabilis ATCC 51599 TaxID=887898 RepID=E7RX57_9BURK|nr:flagellar biosynthesis protein FlhA [Lautropia mirabilis]EFV95048.1 flagellar biosynthesis protein FlhA [Lautropia mirabilis ATCC 51599]VEH01602.1 Flagellar biosynthesis protein flhA [Lautropia mirabilis]